MKIKISAVIITFNEEQNIARCIDSLEGVVDQVVVVDSYSKDKTKEICLEKGAKFVEHAFDGHIEQKNWAITQADYPHILSLDADEALSEELRSSILEAKNNYTADAYKMNRFSSYCGKWIKHCGWYPDAKTRLFDSRKGSWGGENPHDMYIMQEGCTTNKLNGDLLHYTFHTIHQHIDQTNKFSTIAAQMQYNKGKKTNFIKIIFKPIIKFFIHYFLRLGVLDGYYGWVICKNQAFGMYLKQIKLKELHKAAKRNK